MRLGYHLLGLFSLLLSFPYEALYLIVVTSQSMLLTCEGQAVNLINEAPIIKQALISTSN